MKLDARVLGAPKPARETPLPAAIALYALALLLIAAAFRGPLPPWDGMFVAMSLLLAAALCFRSVRLRLVPRLGGALIGIGAGVMLYGLTRVAFAGLRIAWPGFEPLARALFAWKEGRSTPLLLSSLWVIVVAEEAFWRGVITRGVMERTGRAAGIAIGAALYAATHLSSGNPLLVAAAFGCGLFWGYLYAATDDLVAPVASHLVWDLLLLFVLPPI